MFKWILVAILVVAVLAFVFRVAQARRILEMGRDVVLLYFIAIVLIAAVYTWQEIY